MLIFTAEVVCGLPQRSVATAAATGGAIAAGGGFFTEKDVIVEGAFEGICLPLHFYPGEIASVQAVRRLVARSSRQVIRRMRINV